MLDTSVTLKPVLSPTSAYCVETVTSVHHWTDTLFSFRTTRDPGLRFVSGQFVMVGMMGEGGRPLARAYSIASPSWAEELEFYSIKVPDGPLTSRLQHIKVGDQLFISRKPVGTLVNHDLKPGKRLYMLSTGTGLAPFLSLIRDFETYERFDQLILVHGARDVADLAYREYITCELPEDEYLGEMVREKLVYYPATTREQFVNMGRLTSLISTGKMANDLGLPALNPAEDRVMLCGSSAFLKDTQALLDDAGFEISPHTGVPGDYVIERAFVDK